MDPTTSSSYPEQNQPMPIDPTVEEPKVCTNPLHKEGESVISHLSAERFQELQKDSEKYFSTLETKQVESLPENSDTALATGASDKKQRAHKTAGAVRKLFMYENKKEVCEKLVQELEKPDHADKQGTLRKLEKLGTSYAPAFTALAKHHLKEYRACEKEGNFNEAQRIMQKVGDNLYKAQHGGDVKAIEITGDLLHEQHSQLTPKMIKNNNELMVRKAQTPDLSAQYEAKIQENNKQLQESIVDVAKAYRLGAERGSGNCEAKYQSLMLKNGIKTDDEPTKAKTIKEFPGIVKNCIKKSADAKVVAEMIIDFEEHTGTSFVFDAKKPKMLEVQNQYNTLKGPTQEEI